MDNQFIYGQLNEEGVCIAVSYLSGEVIKDNMINLSQIENPSECLGARYVAKSRSWEPGPPIVIEPEPNLFDEIIDLKRQVQGLSTIVADQAELRDMMTSLTQTVAAQTRAIDDIVAESRRAP